MSVKQRLVTAEELLEYPTFRKNVEQIDWGGCRVSPPELSIRISSGWREAGCLRRSIWSRHRKPDGHGIVFA